MRGWFSGEDDVGILINKKRYRRAVKVLRQQLDERPSDVHLRQRLADVLVLAGDGDGALEILSRMVDEFAQEGFDAKAIAVLKKMQRIDPERREIEEMLTGLIKRRNQDVWGEQPRPAPTEASPDRGEIDEATLTEPEATADGTTPAGMDSMLPAVQRSPLFATFSSDELLAVIRGLELLSFEPGEIIVSEGQPGSSLFVLAGGSVRVYVRGAGGGNQQVRMLEEGEFFGEISLLTGQPRTATITAATDTEILELDRRTLDAIVVKHPQVPGVIKEVSRRLSLIHI